MKSLGLISQILTLGLSTAIVFLFIMPAFEEIEGIQSDIDTYKQEREKVERVNADLAGLLAKRDSIPPADMEKLKTYMPPFTDEISVMRDLEFMVEKSDLLLKGVEYVGAQDDAEDGRDDLFPEVHEFRVVAEGTYSQVKDFLSVLEQNEYPLAAQELQLEPLDGGFLTVDVTLATYADVPLLLVPIPNNE